MFCSVSYCFSTGAFQGLTPNFDHESSSEDDSDGEGGGGDAGEGGGGDDGEGGASDSEEMSTTDDIGLAEGRRSTLRPRNTNPVRQVSIDITLVRKSLLGILLNSFKLCGKSSLV